MSNSDGFVGRVSAEKRPSAGEGERQWECVAHCGIDSLNRPNRR